MSLNRHATCQGSIILAGAGFLWATLGVVGADEIKVYRVPKEPLAQGQANLPAGHPRVNDPHNRAARPAPKITYTTPEGWHDIGAGEMRLTGFSIAGTNGQSAQVAITPLPGMVGKENMIVNMWRQQVGLGELSEDEASKQLTAVEVAGEPGKMFDMAGKSAAGATIRIVTAMAHRGEMSWFYKLQGDDELVTAQKPNFVTFLKSVKIEEVAAPAAMPEGHPPIAGSVPASSVPPAPREGGPTWTVPTGWMEISGGQFLFAKFNIAGDGGTQGAVNVSTSAGDGGGLAANVNRWRGQLGQAPWSESELQKNVKEIATAGGKGTLVEMSGTDGRTGRETSLVGVMVTNGGAAWFYKLMGDAKLVEAQKDSFTKFVKEVKY